MYIHVYIYKYGTELVSFMILFCPRRAHVSSFEGTIDTFLNWDE